MSAEKIAAVLAAHTHKTGIRDGRTHCSCGWSGEKFEFGRTLHRRHQSEHVAAALEPVIREARAAAWDECDSLWRFAYPLDHSTSNPYREES